jgi:hypothetical protein
VSPIVLALPPVAVRETALCDVRVCLYGMSAFGVEGGRDLFFQDLLAYKSATLTGGIAPVV